MRRWGWEWAPEHLSPVELRRDSAQQAAAVPPVEEKEQCGTAVSRGEQVDLMVGEVVVVTKEGVVQQDSCCSSVHPVAQWKVVGRIISQQGGKVRIEDLVRGGADFHPCASVLRRDQVQLGWTDPLLESKLYRPEQMKLILAFSPCPRGEGAPPPFWRW